MLPASEAKKAVKYAFQPIQGEQDLHDYMVRKIELNIELRALEGKRTFTFPHRIKYIEDKIEKAGFQVEKRLYEIVVSW